MNKLYLQARQAGQKLQHSAPCSGHHESWAVALNLERTRLS